MDEYQQMLEVVDENDKVIGIENRTKIHKEGLLHREIHVWFITPQGEIIFQHRSKDKDTYPNLLDATVGGHVEPGMSYEETVVKECKEETGFDIDPSKLLLLARFRKKGFDEATGLINNAIRIQYAYLYTGLINHLQVEKGKSEGFEAWKIDDLAHLSDADKNKFIGHILNEDMLLLFQKAKEILVK